MKIYSKLLGRIRNNKTRIKNGSRIVAMGFGLRYGIINPSPINLSFNSTQQIEQADTSIDKYIRMKVDDKVKNDLSNKSSSHLIETGSGVLIGNKPVSEGSKYALKIRSGELGKSGPGSRASVLE